MLSTKINKKTLLGIMGVLCLVVIDSGSTSFAANIVIAPNTGVNFTTTPAGGGFPCSQWACGCYIHDHTKYIASSEETYHLFQCFSSYNYNTCYEPNNSINTCPAWCSQYKGFPCQQNGQSNTDHSSAWHIIHDIAQMPVPGG